MRLIDADSVMCALIDEGQTNYRKYGFKLSELIKFTPAQVGEIIHKMPTIEPERRAGKWICSDDMYETAVCSVCGWDSYEPWRSIHDLFDFCPKCGAKMRK